MWTAGISGRDLADITGRAYLADRATNLVRELRTVDDPDNSRTQEFVRTTLLEDDSGTHEVVRISAPYERIEIEIEPSEFVRATIAEMSRAPQAALDSEALDLEIAAAFAMLHAPTAIAETHPGEVDIEIEIEPIVIEKRRSAPRRSAPPPIPILLAKRKAPEPEAVSLLRELRGPTSAPDDEIEIEIEVEMPMASPRAQLAVQPDLQQSPTELRSEPEVIDIETSPEATAPIELPRGIAIETPPELTAATELRREPEAPEPTAAIAEAMALVRELRDNIDLQPVADAADAVADAAPAIEVRLQREATRPIEHYPMPSVVVPTRSEPVPAMFMRSSVAEAMARQRERRQNRGHRRPPTRNQLTS